jgi:hypothetical protein
MAATSKEGIKLRVELIPPEIYKDMNQEQEFTMVVDPEKLAQVGDGTFAAGAEVALNSIRVMQKLEGQEKSTTLNDKGKEIATIASKIKIPVVLHHEQFTFRLTATNRTTQTLLWTMDIPCQLGVKTTPRAQLASTWSHLPPQSGAPPGTIMTSKCNISAKEMYAEKIEFAGPEVPVAFTIGYLRGLVAHPVTVHLVLQRVHNAATKEPLTIFYGDRVWALRKFALITTKELFNA